MKAQDGERNLYARFKYDGSPPWEGEVYTYCRIFDDTDSLISEGQTRKSPEDQFSRKIGRQLALRRAVSRIYPEDPKKQHSLLSQFFSVGKYAY